MREVPKRACCRRCQFWDPGGLDFIEIAETGECLHIDGEMQFRPWHNVCHLFDADHHVYEPAPHR